jgi:predicted O-methyltransferase YrrM
MKNTELIKNLSLAHNIPIVRDGTIAYIIKLIKEHNYHTILEIGTAFGYSAAMFAEQNLSVSTIEKDLAKYEIASKNLQAYSNVKAHHADAFTFETKEKFDLIFIDGAKSHQDIILEKFTNFLAPNGTIVIDNIFLKKYQNQVLTKNQSKLQQKVHDFENYLRHTTKYHVEIIDLDDGIAIVLPILKAIIR